MDKLISHDNKHQLIIQYRQMNLTYDKYHIYNSIHLLRILIIIIVIIIFVKIFYCVQKEFSRHFLL